MARPAPGRRQGSAPVPVPVLGPAPRAFLWPGLPPGGERRGDLSWRGPGHPPVARRKDGAPVALLTGAEHCPSLLSPGLPRAGRPHRASGPSKCRGARGCWGSGQLRASPKPRCGCPFAAVRAVICYSFCGQNRFSSWHVAWTEATSLLLWKTAEKRGSHSTHIGMRTGKRIPVKIFLPFHI